MEPTILAIESSCDETSAAVIQDGKVLNNIIATQSVHENYGGVVPELASRAHQQHIIPVVDQALKEAQVKKQDLDAIAFTQGPGLLGALLVGSSFAKAMALGLNIPLIAVNHMRAHILAHFIDDPKPSFPFICLTVSGGHTQIVKVNHYLNMEVIGQTRDDAAGEAFDKCAKILELPYPGGPLIDRYAQEGNPLAFNFPKTDVPDLDYSFSGIKTAFLYFIRDEKKKNENFVKENMYDICASIQHSIIQMLFQKLSKAVKQTGIKTVAIAGGVSANSYLRKQLNDLADEKGWQVYIPAFQYCTDNAGMVAISAHYQYFQNDFCDLSVSPIPSMSI